MNKGNVTINIEKLIDNFQVISNGEPLNLSELKEQTEKAITSAISSAEMPVPTEFIPVVAKQDNEGHWYLIPVELANDFSRLLDDSANDEDAEQMFIETFSEYMTGGDLNNKRLFIEAPKTIPRTVEDLAMNPELEKRLFEKFAPINNPFIPKKDPAYIEHLQKDNTVLYRKYALGEWKEKAPERKDLVNDYLKETGEKYYNHSDGPKNPGALEMVEEFHQAFNCPVHTSPVIPDVPYGYAFVMDHVEKIKHYFGETKDKTRAFLRIKLMFEEFTEVAEAIATHDLPKILDGLCDLLYVVYGTAHEFGLGPVLKEAFREVHRSNMSKLGADGKPVYRSDGKVLKGPNFTPPDLANILYRYERNQADIKDWAKAADEALKQGYQGQYEKIPYIPTEGMPEPKNAGVIYSELKQPPPKPLHQITTDDIELVKTCGACPEQYDAYYQGVKVGYLRLRHGHFRVDYPNYGEIYRATPAGDGEFNEDERSGYLTQAKNAIIKQMMENVKETAEYLWNNK